MTTIEYEPVRLAIVGCGNIAAGYGKSLQTRPEKVKIMGAFDVDVPRAQEWVNTYGGRVYRTYEEVLADPDVELVVNLTSHHAHADITCQALAADKHVHSEKPLAANLEDGKRILDLAEQHSRRISCSPFTFLGEAQQTFLKAKQDGIIGKVYAAYSEMNWDRIERWHPNPVGFYQPGAGPLLDVGVYALTVMTTVLGPVKRVRGLGATVSPNRTIGSGPNKGQTFEVKTPDLVVGLLEFETGTVARLTASFFVGRGSKQGPATELHGDTGSLVLTNNHNFDGAVEHYDRETNEWREIPLIRSPYKGVEWGRAIFDLADSLRTATPQRVTGRQAYHVLEIALGILKSGEDGSTVQIQSRFDPPAPLYPEWIEQKQATSSGQ